MAKDVKKKNVKKVEKKKVKKESFFKSLKKEVSAVKWPTAKEIVKYTVATIIFCVIFAAFFILLNVGMAFVKGLFS